MLSRTYINTTSQNIGGTNAWAVYPTSNFGRGVQYVHWVMHKCFMVKVGENEIHRMYVKSK